TNQVRDEPDLLPVMDGLRTLHLARADLRSARELAERGLTIAQGSGDAGLRDAALYGVGAVALLSGEFALARDRLEQVIAGRAATTLKAREIPTLHDPGVTSQVLAAVALWCLGFPDEAGNRARDAVRSARELGHPLTLGNVLVFTSVVQTCRHELDQVRQHAAELRTLATEHGFGRLGPPGTILGGWGLVHQQQVEQGLAWIREGLASYEATSLLLFRPWYLALLAQALASAEGSTRRSTSSTPPSPASTAPASDGARPNSTGSGGKCRLWRPRKGRCADGGALRVGLSGHVRRRRPKPASGRRSTRPDGKPRSRGSSAQRPA